MKRITMLVVAAMVVVFVFGQTAQAVEKWNIYRGDKVIKTLELAEKSVGLIDHIKKTIEINGKEVLLPAEATMIEFPIGSGSDGRQGVMHLSTTELFVRAECVGHKADGDFFIYSYDKPLAIDQLVNIAGNTIILLVKDGVAITGGNECHQFIYDDSHKVRVSPGTKVKIVVRALRETKGVRQMEVTKKTIDF